MPCYYTGSAAGDAALAVQEAGEELTRVTRYFCEAMQAIEDCYGPNYAEEMGFDADLVEMWEDHKAIDRERQEREDLFEIEQAKYETLIERLSDDEIELLRKRL